MLVKKHATRADPCHQDPGNLDLEAYQRGLAACVARKRSGYECFRCVQTLSALLKLSGQITRLGLGAPVSVYPGRTQCFFSIKISRGHSYTKLPHKFSRPSAAIFIRNTLDSQRFLLFLGVLQLNLRFVTILSEILPQIWPRLKIFSYIFLALSTKYPFFFSRPIGHS